MVILFYLKLIQKEKYRMDKLRSIRDLEIFYAGVKAGKSEQKEEITNYFNIFPMYCETEVAKKFEHLRDELAKENLMFKFDGDKYAVFPLEIQDRKPLTEYNLTLKQLDDYVENF